MQNDIKEVDYKYYCYLCKHFDVVETEDPCNDCLAQGWNECSKKPINWKAKD